MFRKFFVNRLFLRTGGLILGNIDNYPDERGKFTPYFQYEIGPYNDDFRLYFPKLPNAKLYYNSIFLKLWAYNPQDAIKYIEDHYNSYPDKNDFLLFLKRQLQYRIDQLKHIKSLDRVSLATISLNWVEEKIIDLKDSQKVQVYDQYIKQELTLIIKNELQSNSSTPSDAASVNKLTDQITANLQMKMDAIVNSTEEKMTHLADKYETGDIQLANVNLKDKLIALFICLKDSTSKPTKNNKSGDPLFSKMDLTDIAQILRLHFTHYKGSKVDSIERPIYKVNNSVKGDPAYQDLTKALQSFFFIN